MAKTWISEALEVDRALSVLAEPERRTALASRASKKKLSAATLARQLRAARYVAQQAVKDKIDLADVRASAIAIRALMALEKHDPAEASRVRDDVLSGRLSTRKTAALAKLASTQPHKMAMPGIAWHKLSACVLDTLKEAEVVEYGKRSEISRMVRLDMEVPATGGRSTAIFLSPRQSLSAFRGRPVIDQVPFVFMALNFFHRVTYFFLDQQERRLIERLADHSLAKGRIDVIDLAAAWEKYIVDFGEN